MHKFVADVPKLKPMKPFVFNSISALHKAMGLPKPLHPLISLVDYGSIQADVSELSKGMVLNFYKVSFKKNFHGKINQKNIKMPKALANLDPKTEFRWNLGRMYVESLENICFEHGMSKFGKQSNTNTGC